MTLRKLTPKQELFCTEYLVDLNATQAVIRAGYSKNGATSKGSQLLANVNVQNCIAKQKTKRIERVEIDADYVLNRLRQIDEMDIAEILDDEFAVKPLSEWPVVWRRALSGMDVSELWAGTGEDREAIGTLKKIKWPDKLKNLELLGKHIAVGAFKETIDHNHKGAVTMITRRVVDPVPKRPKPKSKK